MSDLLSASPADLLEVLTSGSDRDLAALAAVVGHGRLYGVDGRRGKPRRLRAGAEPTRLACGQLLTAQVVKGPARDRALQASAWHARHAAGTWAAALCRELLAALAAGDGTARLTMDRENPLAPGAIAVLPMAENPDWISFE